jgi:uncharacterized RDD family membrane protein YckC
MSEYQFSSNLPFAANAHHVDSHPRASFGHRFGGYALSAALILSSAITLFIGYVIWALILWGQGQTPSKQILKMRVFSMDSGKPATWGHMAVRQFLIPLAFSCVYIPFFVLAMSTALDYNQALSSTIATFGSLAVFGLELADSFWILRGDERQRLTDKWARTYVVNEA